ncbi:hypothetical protein [Aminirod propionatiphilus]|uniref:Uncharacterized protein n=1 Tax=Aminirod propionatiphilus TaxID=3415223 RepID=A0ACD1DYH7_9BACT|nr:hypothetical protein KIH16_05295 [Synergistota bacterium]
MRRKEKAPLVLVCDDERLLRRLRAQLGPLGRPLLLPGEADDLLPSDVELVLVAGKEIVPEALAGIPRMDLPLALPSAALREALRTRLGRGGYEALCLEAEELITANRLSEAEETLRLAISLGPSRPEAFFLAATILEKNGSPFEAQENYATALALESGYEPARKALDRLAEGERVEPEETETPPTGIMNGRRE